MDLRDDSCDANQVLERKRAVTRSFRELSYPKPSPTIRLTFVSADDNRLISECLRGRTEAFEELVRRYQDRLYNTVYRLLGHAEDARDAVQEAFINAYQSLNSFKGDSQFYTWLYRIAINTAISLKRKSRSMPVSGSDRGLGEPIDPSPASSPGHALEMAEDERRVQKALNRLSPEHRAVLILKDLEGQKYEEMAEILNVPIGTVRSRLHRARSEMRQLLTRD